MSKDPFQALQKAMEQTFEDQTKRIVPIFGAGLNIQAFHNQKGGLDWDGLLGKVAENLSISLPQNPSMTARWETMVQEYAAHHDQQANLSEDALRKEVCCTLAGRSHQETHLLVMQQKYRDMLTLNFGSLLAQSTKGASLQFASYKTQKTKETGKDLLQKRTSRRHRQYYSCQLKNGIQSRIWHPHGIVEDPETIVLGIRDYGVYIEELRRAFGVFKRDEKKFFHPLGNPHNREALEEWEQTRRSHEQEEFGSLCSWLELFMLSDLMFVGCGLGQDEFPLWWVLHQRARNFARYAPEERPRTFYLTTQQDLDEKRITHLENTPANVEIVAFESHSQLWETLLLRNKSKIA